MEEVALPSLGGGVIDLEDAQVDAVVAIGKGVETGSEEDVLGGAGDGGIDESVEIVFGVAAACKEESAQGDGEGFMKFIGGFGELFRVLLAEHGDGDGVFEDEGRRVVELMGGAAKSDAEGGAGWVGFQQVNLLKRIATPGRLEKLRIVASQLACEGDGGNWFLTGKP
jgi:hypothetical protein